MKTTSDLELEAAIKSIFPKPIWVVEGESFDGMFHDFLLFTKKPSRKIIKKILALWDMEEEYISIYEMNLDTVRE